MADAPESDRPTLTEVNEDSTSSIFGSDIGDDWGAAFEADDFMLAHDDDVSNEFFLEEDELDDVTASKATDTPTTSSPIPQESDRPRSSTLPDTLIHSALSAPAKIRTFFLSLPLLYRVPILILVVLTPLFFIFTKQPSPPAIVEPTTVPPPVKTPEKTPEKIAKLEALLASPAAPEKTREKWHFPSFLISSSDAMKGDNIFFVEADITFILLLEAGEKLPNDKSIFVRDIIYQFFNNRPLYELRRYSLARGEMNRKLRDWVEKQWPEGNIASIVFNRYQVL